MLFCLTSLLSQPILVVLHPHGLNPGDVIYIAQGTGGAHVAAHYTVFETPSDTTITTSPALGGMLVRQLYSSIFFVERFTNGPYAIQNSTKSKLL